MKRMYLLVIVALTALVFSSCSASTPSEKEITAISSVSPLDDTASNSTLSNEVTTQTSTTTVPALDIATPSNETPQATPETVAPVETNKPTTNAPKSVETPKPATSAPKPAATPKPATNAPKPAATKKPATSAPKPAATTAPAKTNAWSTGYQREAETELLRLINEYRKQNGLSQLTSEGGWKAYTDRMTKIFEKNFHSEGGAEVHAFGIMENWGSGFYISQTTTKEMAKKQFERWKKSPGHNNTMLDKSGKKAKYMATSVYFDAKLNSYNWIVVLEDVSYEGYYNSYSRVLVDETWYENGGYWDKNQDGTHDWIPIFLDKDGNEKLTRTEMKKAFEKKGYLKYYPHLKWIEYNQFGNPIANAGWKHNDYNSSDVVSKDIIS